MTVPVKLKDSAAPSELQTFTSTEENYLAYQAGLQLSASANSGLQLTDTGTNYIIGTFTDTSYDDAVGTSAEAGLATTTVTTTVRQRGSTATTSGSDYRVPVKNLTESGQQVIREMNASDLNTLLDSFDFSLSLPQTIRALSNLQRLPLVLITKNMYQM